MIATAPAPAGAANQAPVSGSDPGTDTAFGCRGAGWAPVLGAYLLSRLVVLAGAVAAALHWGRAGLVWKVLGTWDGRWYLDLARHGYPAAVPAGTGAAAQSTLAFFPLYPLAVRVTAAVLPIGELGAALVLSLVAGAAACLAVRDVAAVVLGEGRANRAAVAFTFFPGAFILSMVYAEGLTIALAAVSLAALLRRRWWLAGITAGLATACRPNAVALVAACAVAAVAHVRAGRDRRELRPLALAPGGLMLTMAVLWIRTGSPLVWLDAERAGWRQTFDAGLTTVRTMGSFLTGPVRDADTLVVGLGVVAVFVLGRALWKQRPPAVLTAYVAVVLALCYASSSLNGRPRFLLTAFPLVFPVAILSRRAYVGVVAASAVAMAIMMWFVGSHPRWAA